MFTNQPWRGLEDKGANLVVTDLSFIELNNASSSPADAVPSALERFEEIAAKAENKRIAVLLDYD
ncbi:MAG: hypothetical protein R6X07_01410, partial [Desulfatiglandales bacterium]